MNENKVSKKNVADAIGTFIMKHQKNSNNVEWSQWDFKIQSVIDVKIDEEPLEDFKKTNNIWTFKGTANICRTDGVTKVLESSECAIIGSAEVSFYPNDWIKNELLPEVKHITITKIKL